MFQTRGLLFGCIFVVFILATSCTNGTSQNCTQMGCLDGFTVQLKKEQWSSGHYIFNIEIDGWKIVCEVTMPLANCDVTETCTSPDVHTALSGCALSPDQHAVSEVTTSIVKFKEMKLSISQDGQPILHKVLRPEFKTFRPNGPNCDPICQNALDTVSF